jgi:hypothetical protein
VSVRRSLRLLLERLVVAGAVGGRPAARLRDFLQAVTSADLLREVDVPENGTTPVNECLCTVFEEEFQHNRYAVGDLAYLE